MTNPDSADESRRHLENLRAVFQEMQRPRNAGPSSARTPGSGRVKEDAPDEAGKGWKRKSILGGLGALAVTLAGKLKFLGLLAGVLKFKTLGTMLLSVALYAHEWGWAFAVGFVLLIFVHESGHALVMKLEGIPAGAPVFIPFVGAFIAMRGWPRNAYVEAKVAMGGPLVGSVAAWALLAAGLALSHPLLITLGHTGILLNLFNLIPVSPLDGGRIAGAFSRSSWVLGYSVGVLALIWTRSPILFVVMIVGLFTLWQRWHHPVPGYNEIPRSARVAVGISYAALLAALLLTFTIGQPVSNPGI